MRHFLKVAALLLVALLAVVLTSGCGGSNATNNGYAVRLVRLNGTAWEAAPLNNLHVNDNVDVEVESLAQKRGGVDFTATATRPDGSIAPHTKSGWLLDVSGEWTFKVRGTELNYSLETNVAN